MDFTIRIMMAASIITVTSCLYGMDEDLVQGSALKVYVVPGLGGYKKEEAKKNQKYSNMLFKVDDGKTDVVIRYIVTPPGHGLGQNPCMDDVERAIQQDQEQDAREGKQYDQSVLLAFSQGAATVANLMKENKLNIPNLKIMIVEGLFLSANDALHDSIHGVRSESYGALRGLPYLRYWLPYVAQMLKFPHYRPAGPQPIHALPYIPKELPLVIIHGKKDQRVSHDDNAMVLYNWLREQGKDNVYLISKEGSDDAIAQEKDHVTVLESQDVPALHAILRKHHILPAKQGADDQQIDLTKYQPQFEQSTLQHYIALYHAKHEQHKIHERIEQGLEAATIVASVAVTYWALKSMLNRKSHTASGDAAVTLTDCMQDAMPDKAFYLSNMLASLDQYLLGK